MSEKNFTLFYFLFHCPVFGGHRIGDINQFPEVFFTDFDLYFDNVNLMLYSNTQYYIDATGSLYTWSLDKWIEAVGNDPSKLSIGFYIDLKIAIDPKHKRKSHDHNKRKAKHNSCPACVILCFKSFYTKIEPDKTN
jgi:hypothetical protein